MKDESNVEMVSPTADLREASMPDSPTDPAAHPPQGAPVSSPNSNPSSVPVVADVRSLSNNSSSPAVNGVHTSPNGPVSPSSIGNSVTQLPPACGARQLSKLKRFLTTLQQFGSDISPEIGERVRGLVMNLVVCTILLWLEFCTLDFLYTSIIPIKLRKPWTLKYFWNICVSNENHSDMQWLNCKR